MKTILVVLAVLAAGLGGAGGVALVLEHRLAALAPGGVDVARLHYNPFSGRLVLEDVRARDAEGAELFRAARVTAVASPVPLLAGSLRLARVRVDAPRLTLAAPLASAPDLPLRIEDLAATDGQLVIAHAGAGGRPLRADAVHLRMDRLTTRAPAGQSNAAFALEMVTFDTLVRVTGQPRAGGYALHVRARDVDVATLVRALPEGTLGGLQAGRLELDAVLRLVAGGVVASGHVRTADAVVALPVRGRPRLRARTVLVVADAFDPVSGTGRLTRVLVDAPSLALPMATAGSTLTALLERLQTPADLLIRRVAVTGGTLALTGAGGVRLQRVQLTARTRERDRADGWALSASAALDSGADVTLDGRLALDLHALDAAARVRRAALTPWRPLAGPATDWDARVVFEGRLRVAGREGAVTLTGQAVPAGGEGGGREAAVGVHHRVAAAGPGAAVRELLAALESAAHAASGGF